MRKHRNHSRNITSQSNKRSGVGATGMQNKTSGPEICRTSEFCDVASLGALSTLSDDIQDAQADAIKTEMAQIEASISTVSRQLIDSTPCPGLSDRIEAWTKHIAGKIDHLTETEEQSLLNLVIDKIVVNFNDGSGYFIDIMGAIPEFINDSSMGNTKIGPPAYCASPASATLAWATPSCIQSTPGAAARMSSR